MSRREKVSGELGDYEQVCGGTLIGRFKGRMWYRLSVALVLALLVPGSASGSASSRSTGKRVERERYRATVGVTGVLAFYPGELQIGGVVFPGGRERFVDVKVTDDAGGRVAGSVAQYRGQREVTFHDFCGRTKRPVKIKRFLNVQIYVYQGVCEDMTPSIATSGTVTGVFTRKR